TSDAPPAIERVHERFSFPLCRTGALACPAIACLEIEELQLNRHLIALPADLWRDARIESFNVGVVAHEEVVHAPAVAALIAGAGVGAIAVGELHDRHPLRLAGERAELQQRVALSRQRLEERAAVVAHVIELRRDRAIADRMIEEDIRRIRTVLVLMLIAGADRQHLLLAEVGAGVEVAALRIEEAVGNARREAQLALLVVAHSLEDAGA